MNRVRISGKHYKMLQEHLFPGDYKEAVAIALCGRSNWKGNTTLVVQEIFLIPYDKCFEAEEITSTGQQTSLYI